MLLELLLTKKIDVVTSHDPYLLLEEGLDIPVESLNQRMKKLGI